SGGAAACANSAPLLKKAAIAANAASRNLLMQLPQLDPVRILCTLDAMLKHEACPCLGILWRNRGAGTHSSIGPGSGIHFWDPLRCFLLAKSIVRAENRGHFSARCSKLAGELFWLIPN